MAVFLIVNPSFVSRALSNLKIIYYGNEGLAWALIPLLAWIS